MAKYIAGTPADNIQLDSSRPIYIIAWEFTGATTRLSTGGSVTFDGNTYSAGVELVSYTEGISAVVQVPATNALIDDVLTSAWRNGAFTLYAIPSTPSDTTSYTAAEGILLLDGVIDSANYSRDIIKVSALSTILAGKYAPNLYYTEACNHLPAPGEVLTWEQSTETIAAPPEPPLTWQE